VRYEEDEWVEFLVGPNEPSKGLLRQARSAEKKIEKMMERIAYVYSGEKDLVALTDDERARVTYMLYMIPEHGAAVDYDRETFKDLLEEVGVEDRGLRSAITHTLLVKGKYGDSWPPGVAAILQPLSYEIAIEGVED
jgi:hypothetical protein